MSVLILVDASCPHIPLKSHSKVPAYPQHLLPQWEVEGRAGRVERALHCTLGHLGLSGSEQAP